MQSDPGLAYDDEGAEVFGVRLSFIADRFAVERPSWSAPPTAAGTTHQQADQRGEKAARTANGAANTSCADHGCQLTSFLTWTLPSASRR